MMGPFGQFGGGTGWGGWVAVTFTMVVLLGMMTTAVVLIIRSVGHGSEATLEPTDRTAAPPVTDERVAHGDSDAEK